MTLQSKRIRGLSLVAGYLANVLWIIESSWHSLVTEGYGKNAVAYSALRLLSQSIPEARLKAYTGEGDDKEDLPSDHPLMQLINRPNQLMTEFEFWELTTLQLAVVGRSHWWKERTRGGEVLALWPLRPDRVSPIYSNDPASPVISGWAYSDPNGDIQALRRQDVLSFNFPDPDGESGGIVEGFGPLSAGRADIASDNLATAHTGALLANHAQPGIALKVTDSIPDEATATLIKSKFRQEFGGSNLGGVGIVDAGTEIMTFGYSLKDLEFSGLRSDTESRICAVLGVPSILVGVNSGLSSSTYSNYENARLFFTETTLAFYWRRYADQMTADLAPEFGEGITCEFDTSTVKALADQFEKQIAPWTAAFTAAALTVNEYRGKLGLEPLPPEVGDKLYVPNSVGTVGATEQLIAQAEERRQEVAEQMQPRQEQGQQQPPSTNGTGPDEDEAIRAWVPIKAHLPERIKLACPLCQAPEVDRYGDHGGLCVCGTCGCTFDPVMEAA